LSRPAETLASALESPDRTPNSVFMPLDILLVTVSRGLVELALLALIGQGILAVLAGKHREQNAFYRVLRLIASPAVRVVRLVTPRVSPAVRVVRLVTPRVILDAHVPWVTLFVLLWLWIGLAVAKRHLCGLHGLAC